MTNFCRHITCLSICFVTTNITITKAGVGREPVDCKEERIQKLGSIIKGKDSLLGGLFEKKSQKDEKPAESKTVKPSGAEKTSRQEKLFDAAMEILKKFPLNKADRAGGNIETSLAKVSDFDSTMTCEYKINVGISDEGDLKVSVASKEDSKSRLKRHEESLKKQILQMAK
jgi:hypothetical protein